MTPYRIMLVDDEAAARESIKRNVDWNAIGFEVSGDAENGMDALEQLEIVQPHILLTDIRMPYMDGLTLASKVHKLYPSIRIVIFSGFNEFEYAKDAIKYGVTDYILKPVNVEELTAILQKLHQELDDELRQRRNINVLRDSFQRNLPILQEHFLNDLVHDQIEPNRIPFLLDEYKLNLGDTNSWVVATAIVTLPQKSHAPLDSTQEFAPLWLRQLVDEHLGNYTHYSSFQRSSGLCIVAAVQPDDGMEGLVAVLDRICKECKRIFHLEVTIGVGTICDRLEKISRSYNEARDAIGYRAMLPDVNVFYIGDVKRNHHRILPTKLKKEEMLLSAIRLGNEKEIQKAVSNIFHQMKKQRLHFSQYQFTLIGLLDALLNLLNSFGIEASGVMGVNWLTSLSTADNVEKLQVWFQDLCQRIAESIYTEQDSSNLCLVQKAQHFIHENYLDSQLSVETVCEHLHVNTKYFSTIFKKQTGMSYVTYLTNLRLNTAADLLLSCDDKTYQIAEKVGYVDSNYFSYVFKKHFGLSPTRYREAKQGGVKVG